MQLWSFIIESICTVHYSLPTLEPVIPLTKKWNIIFKHENAHKHVNKDHSQLKKKLYYPKIRVHFFWFPPNGMLQKNYNRDSKLVLWHVMCDSLFKDLNNLHKYSHSEQKPWVFFFSCYDRTETEKNAMCDDSHASLNEKPRDKALQGQNESRDDYIGLGRWEWA